jgi:hypothetical protein
MMGIRKHTRTNESNPQRLLRNARRRNQYPARPIVAPAPGNTALANLTNAWQTILPQYARYARMARAAMSGAGRCQTEDGVPGDRRCRKAEQR